MIIEALTHVKLVAALGLTYAAVPLYRAFCAATGYSGTPMTASSRYSEPSRLVPSYTDPYNAAHATERIRVSFNASTSNQIPWSFVPEQREIFVLTGETALTFFKAHNKSDQDIIGIATYNVIPDRIAPYFNKIECFCFEEQKIRAGEEIDLPVFFFLDKEMLEDKESRDVKDIILAYTFFSARRNPVNGQLEYVPQKIKTHTRNNNSLQTRYRPVPLHCWKGCIVNEGVELQYTDVVDTERLTQTGSMTLVLPLLLVIFFFFLVLLLFLLARLARCFKCFLGCLLLLLPTLTLLFCFFPVLAIRISLAFLGLLTGRRIASLRFDVSFVFSFGLFVFIVVILF